VTFIHITDPRVGAKHEIRKGFLVLLETWPSISHFIYTKDKEFEFKHGYSSVPYQKHEVGEHTAKSVMEKIEQLCETAVIPPGTTWEVSRQYKFRRQR